MKLILKDFGSAAEWFSGFASIFTIILTIGYYNKDNSPKIYTRLLNKESIKKNDTELTDWGVTLEIMNAGKVPTKVKFEGLISGYTKIEEIQRWIFLKLSKFSSRAWEVYQSKTHENQIPSIEYLSNDDYILLSPLKNTISIPISQEKLIELFKDCIKTSIYQQKRIRNDKHLIFHFIVNDFLGKEYKKSIILYSNEDDYLKLKKEFIAINCKCRLIDLSLFIEKQLILFNDYLREYFVKNAIFKQPSFYISMASFFIGLFFIFQDGPYLRLNSFLWQLNFIFNFVIASKAVRKK